MKYPKRGEQGYLKEKIVGHRCYEGRIWVGGGWGGEGETWGGVGHTERDF